MNFVPLFARYVYKSIDISQQALDTYLKERDPDLCWPGKAWLAARADATGARLSPVNEALGDGAPCISLYCDSFTFSNEVEVEHAWGNLLASMLSCRVANYGVGGYGTDQALLRLDRHVQEGRALGETLILSLFPDNLNRNVNQWRYLLTGNSDRLGFKPVFADGPQGMVQRPSFSCTLNDANSLIRAPEKFLVDEQYLPGTC